MPQDKSTEDLPQIVAAVMAAVPSLVLKTGWAYLHMRKRAHQASKHLEQELVSRGIPSEFAEKLADQFAKDLSIKRMIQSMDIPFSGAWK